MVDTQVQTMVFMMAALVIGAVIFGGTTLAYFIGKRPSTPPCTATEAPRRGPRDAAGEHEAEPRREAA